MVVGIGLRNVLDGVNRERYGLAVDGDEHDFLVHIHVQLVRLDSSGVLRRILRKKARTVRNIQQVYKNSGTITDKLAPNGYIISKSAIASNLLYGSPARYILDFSTLFSWQ